jgi:hypothetical protein
MLARRQGDFPLALTQYNEAMSIWREQGNRVNYAVDLHARNCVLYEQRDYRAAVAAMSEAQDLFRQLCMPHWIASVGNALASALFHLEEFAEAGRLHREGIAWSLERIAVLESVQGEALRAARLLGAAYTARKEFGVPRDRWDQADWEAAEQRVRSRLLGDEFAREFEMGSANSRADAISFALFYSPTG